MQSLIAKARFLASLMFLALAGCNGLLAVQPGNGQRPCTTANDCKAGDLCINGFCGFGNQGNCWIYNADGTCPVGSHCADGVCSRGSTDWCDCQPEQGCLNGRCVEVNEDTQCSDSRPDGACPQGSQGAVCVAGTCIDINQGNICSVNRLSGLCPSGTACVGGRCAVISEDPCSASNTDGLCPSGSRCSGAGKCELVPCSPAAPNGACTTLGEVCADGGCQALPCSTQNLAGPCAENNTFCSASGKCIPFGTCASNLDCDAGTYCGAAGVCRPNGTCVDAADCGNFYTCSASTCVRDLDCANDTGCPPGEHCLNYAAGGQCGPLYSCVDSTDCSDGEYCSTIGECSNSGQCFQDGDCVGAHCSNPGGCRCSTINTCIPADGCAVNADCALGERCTGVSCVAVASCNHTTCPGAGCCAASDQRCSTSDRCIAVGRCLSNADCAPGTTCDTTEGTCSNGTACTTDGQCGAGKFCSYYGVCATGTRGTACTTTFDCPEGQVCNRSFTCELGSNCGGEEFATTEVPPNMLILLDRSGSMNESVNDTCGANGSTKRWNVAVNAIAAVLADRQGHIRFGLSTYPSNINCGGASDCDSGCNSTCNNGCNVANIPAGSTSDSNCEPGYVDQPVGSTSASINASLAANDPGGRTPTARALRTVANNPGLYGLPNPSDPVVRDNYILLITDGDPNCESGGTNCLASCRGNSCSANCLVNTELDRLTKLAKPVKTYTVGFAFTSIRPNLNCNAVYGGTSLCSAATVTPSNCGSYTAGACYYQASDASALVAALSEISQTISGCTFDIDQTPPDLERLYVFTRDIVGGVPVGSYDPVAKNDTANPNGYYTLVGRRIQLFGAVCDHIRAGEKKPIVVYGCPQPGG